ncbi:MAG: hypothetical protein UHS50_04930, partial [Bacteroidaceae bacterium]|nr:hypothetical protein [Bacteroidaceae bacterium]
MRITAFSTIRTVAFRSLMSVFMGASCAVMASASGADTLSIDLSTGILMALEQSPSARSARHSFLSS